jgi:arginase
VKPIAVLDAPSNLGLRPPAPGVVPGCYKLAGALRDLGFLGRVGARDAGYLVPPRYDLSGWQEGHGIFNAAAVALYSRRLADRTAAILDAGEFAVILGGDCSVLFGPALGLRRRGRFGLAYLDGSADFLRHEQVGRIGASAGETLAVVTGRGQPDVVSIDGLGPYFRDTDIVVLGNRDDDPDIPNLAAAAIACWTSPAISETGPETVAAKTLSAFDPLDGFWVHLDVDVLDESVMPAVDAPDPGGLDHGELIELLRPLLADDRCAGINVTIYDPDRDPDGRYAVALTDTLVAAFAGRTNR